MDNIYIMGHKNPDTDSISASIAYAEYKKAVGCNAIPVRIGEVNKETRFVLNYFGVDIPQLLVTVKTQVCDLDIDLIEPVTSDLSIKSAWALMKKNNVKVLPVVNENEKFLGIVTLSDITRVYMDTADNDNLVMRKTPLKNIIETLNAKVVVGSQRIFNITGRVLIAAMTPEEMEPFIQKGDLIIVGNRSDNQIKAIELGANCVIISCDGKVDEAAVKLAEKKNCIIMTTANDTFTTARLINQSVPIGFFMTTENIVSFNINDFIDDIKSKMLQTRYRSYPVLDNGKKIKGFLSRYHLISQRKKKVILLDHNEKSQTIDGIEQAEILELIDHHRIGDIQTGMPVYFVNEPVGSTSTIIANMFFKNNVKLTGPIAGILCAAIISDTIKFKSPTCTVFDKEMAVKLGEIAQIDIDSFAVAMFREGTSLLGKTPKDVLFQDFKEYNLGKYRIGVGQINTMDESSVEELKKPLLDYMDKVCRNNHFDLVILLITDIVRGGSAILYTGKEKGLACKAFNIPYNENSVYAQSIVSRKKQVIPMLSAAID